MAVLLIGDEATESPMELRRVGFPIFVLNWTRSSQNSGAQLAPLLNCEARNIEAFCAGLRELGYVEGRDTTLELRFGEGPIELVALKPAVIVAGSPAAALAARNVTRSIPI